MSGLEVGAHIKIGVFEPILNRSAEVSFKKLEEKLFPFKADEAAEAWAKEIIAELKPIPEKIKQTMKKILTMSETIEDTERRSDYFYEMNHEGVEILSNTFH